ncbi:hypothetical protein ACMT4L_16920 [Deinococcus sp. A31D244]|uniref:hypothetical protein n=1 Tax=Deinococcus sp. A31D244 TaxID=3397675 RepID=UPI0039E06362
MSTIPMTPLALTDGDAARLLCVRMPDRFRLLPVEGEPNLFRLFAECGAGQIDTDLLVLNDTLNVGPYENGRAQWAVQLAALELQARMIVSLGVERGSDDYFWVTLDTPHTPRNVIQTGRAGSASLACVRALAAAVRAWGVYL